MKNMLAAIVLGMSVANIALAEDGVYLALDSGQSRFDDACKGVPATVSCNDTGTAVRIAGGYNFSKIWTRFSPGVEAGMAYLGKAKYSGASLGSGGFYASALTLEGTGALAVSDAFFVIAKLGIVEAFSKLNVTVPGFGKEGGASARTNTACAIGVQYDFSRQMGIRAQYENLRIFGKSKAEGQTPVHLIGAGLIYRFY